MKDEFKIGDSVCEIHDKESVGRVVAIAEYECYVSWYGNYATWVPTSSLEKVE